MKAVAGKDYTNTISADQVIAEAIGRQTRFPSLELSDGSGTGGAGHSLTLAFDRNGTPLPAENSPRRLFERLFVPDDASSREATLRRYVEKRSILDDVAAEAKALEKSWGAPTSRKLPNTSPPSARPSCASSVRKHGWTCRNPKWTARSCNSPAYPTTATTARCGWT